MTEEQVVGIDEVQILSLTATETLPNGRFALVASEDPLADAV